MAREVHELTNPMRFFKSDEYSTRLLLVNSQLNPRDRLGKVGITFHSPLTGFEQFSIKVMADVVDEHGQKEAQILYLNRNSIKKYLKAIDPDFDLQQANDKQLIEKLNQPGIAKKQDTGPRHAGQYNTRKTGGFMDSLVGRFFSWLYLKTVSSIDRLKLRFLFINREKQLFEVSEILANRRAKEASESVPAYQRHLRDKQFQLRSKVALQDIPMTTKDTYIKPYGKQPWLTHVNGKLPKKSKIDTSTGTTEAPTIWERSTDEIETVQNTMTTAWTMVMGERTPFLINAFALGPWATGLSVHEIARQMGSVYSIGADIDKIMQAVDQQYEYEQYRLSEEVILLITKLKPKIAAQAKNNDHLKQLVNTILYNLLNNPKKTVHNAVLEQINNTDNHYLKPCLFELTQLCEKLNAEKKQISITGYPPFLLELPKHAKAKGYDFAKYHIVAGAAGQAVGEPMRQRMKEEGYMKVSASYGASDLDINLGFETDTEIEIRNLLQKNPQMARELFGPNKGIPMIFRFDPLNYHVACGEQDDHLIFTCNRENRSSPRIRYDLKDTGRIYAASDVNAMLTKHGLFNSKTKSPHNLPFLFIWGRDSTAGYGTCNVPFDELESALRDVDVTNKILKRAFFSYKEQHVSRFDIWLELNDEASFFNEEETQQFHCQLIQSMAQRNEYFAEEINRLKEDDLLPNLLFFTRKASPIDEPGGQRKQVLVFEKGVNFDGNFKQDADTRQASQLTKKDYLAYLATLNVPRPQR